MTQDPLQTLIVEDDEDQRVLLTRILQSRGHEVVACGTSAEGLAAYQRNPFPLVILDVMLPDMNGMDLCREMRLVPESAQTRTCRRELLTMTSMSERISRVVASTRLGAPPPGSRALDSSLLT